MRQHFNHNNSNYSGQSPWLHTIFDQIVNQTLQELMELMAIDNDTFGGGEKPNWIDNELSGDRHIYEDDIRVIVAWTLIGGFGVATNILILICIINNRRMCGAASYWFIMSLSVCDISMLVVYFAHLIPSTTLHDTYFTVESLPNAIGIFIYDVFWYTGVLHLVLMAGNRYCNICYPKVYHQVFTKRNTLLLIAGALLSGIVVSIPGLFECCRLIYNHNIYAAQYYSTTDYSYVDITLNSASILAMIFCYVRIVIKVRSSRMVVMRYSGDGLTLHPSRNSSRRNVTTLLTPQRPQTLCVRQAPPRISRREMRLLFQFCSVSTIFLLTWATWQWLPYMSSSKWVGFAVTSLFYINNCTNPTVYLIFNSQLRREVKRILCCLSKEKTKVSEKGKVEKKVPVKRATSLRPDMPLTEVSDASRPSISSCQIQQNSSIEEDERSDSSDLSLDSAFAAPPEPNSVLREFIAAQMALPCAILKAGNQQQKTAKKPRKSATFSSVDSGGNVRSSIGTVITTTTDGNLDLSPLHLTPPELNPIETTVDTHVDMDVILPAIQQVPTKSYSTPITSAWVTTV